MSTRKLSRKLSLIALAVGSMASLFALDAHAATTAIGIGLQHGGMLAGLGTASGAAALAFGIGSTSNADGNHATTSKWFRVAVEGATTDGRNIEREWIQQMPAMAPRTNGQLDAALTKAKGAWAQCAAKVDMIVDCQAKAGQGTPAHD